MGFTQAISNENAFIVRNYKSTRDPVPKILAPFSCCKIEGNIYQSFKTIDKYNIINFTNMTSNKFDHIFKSSTYQGALTEELNYFYPKYCK